MPHLYFINYFIHNKELELETSKLKLLTAVEVVTVGDGVTTMLMNIPHPCCCEHLPCGVHVYI